MKKTLLSAVSAFAILMAGSVALAQDQSPADSPTEQNGPSMDTDTTGDPTTGTGDAATSGGESSSTTDLETQTEPDQLDPDSEEPATDTTPGGAATGADTGTTMPDMDDDTATDMSDTAAPVDLTQLHPYDGDPSGITVEGVPAEDIVGGTLLNQEGEQIANINDLLVDSDGQPQGLLVGFGGFLGLMEKTVAVGFDRVDLTPNEDNEYRTDLTEQEIEAMPEYEEPET